MISTLNNTSFTWLPNDQPIKQHINGVNLDIVPQLFNNTVKLRTITDHCVYNKLVKWAILSSIFFCEQFIMSVFILIIMM